MTDLISRADAIACLSHGEGCGHSCRNRINALPSAELTLQTPQTYGKSINPSNAEVAEDYISRADAIKAVEQEYRVDRGYMVDDYTYGFNQAIQYVSDIILHDLPSADAEWIPVSERLPRYFDNEYIVMIKEGKIPTTLYYLQDGGWWDTDNNIEYDVVAWMPLPKPYREDDE